MFAVAVRPDMAAKVFHSRRRAGKLDKVKAMVERPPAGAYETIEGFPVLTWPRDLLSSSASGKTFVGYLMARVPARDFVPFYQITSSARREGLAGTPVTWDRLVLLGMRLCHVVRTLHRFGYAVGDLNDRNVLVSRRFTPLLMDTDSFQVPKGRWGHYPSIVGDQQYWPPELLEVDLARHKGDRTEGDRYALGVLLFQLFLNGLRPYQARGAAVDGLDSLAAKTRQGGYPWAKPRPGVLEPPAGAPDYLALPPSIRAAFEGCFVAGHRKPDKRPTAEDWYRTLANVWESGFRSCPVESRHVYGKDAATCPWCADPNDPFGAPRSRPRAAGRLIPPVPQVRVTGGPGKPAKSAARRSPPARRARSAPAKPPQMLVTPHPPAAARSAQPRAHAVAAAPRLARGKRPRRRDPPRARSAKRWTARVLWFTAMALFLTGPAFLLAGIPLGLEKKATMVGITIVFLFCLGALPAWRWLSRRPAQVLVLGGWLAVATVATMAVAAAGRWDWLLVATGSASLGLGLLTFITLERGTRDAFLPGAPGVMHAVLGFCVAYLPVLVLWWWSRL